MSKGAFCVWIKSVSNDFSIELTENSNIFVTKTLFNTVVDSSTEASCFWGLCGGKTLWREKDPGEKEREKR